MPPADDSLPYADNGLNELRFSLVPHPFEPPRGDAGVARRVLGIAVTEPILNQTEVLPLVGEGVAAGVHVRMNSS
jgi:hypothetical protein